MAVAALAASPAAWATLLINAVEVPTLIGNGQTVQGNVQYSRVSGSGNETITLNTPALLEIVAPLPAGCTLAGAAGTPQSLTCTTVNPGDNPGDAGSFNFSVKGIALGGNSVSATAAGGNTNTDSFSVISGGDLTVGKTISPTGTIINGQTVVFTLTPAINGDSVPAGTKITVIDSLPGSVSEFQLTGYSAAGYTCNSVSAANTARQLICSINGPLASLPAITVQGRPTTGGVGSLQNAASIDTAPVNAGDQPTYIDAVANNNTAFVNFNVSPGADPRPTGSFPASAVTGSTQNLTINYVNNGPQSTTGGQVRVAIPAGFTPGVLPAGCVNSGPGTVNGVTGTVLTCTSGTVTSGGSQAFQIPLTVPGTAGAGNFGVEIVTGAGGSLPGGLTDSDTSNNAVLVPYSIVDPYADLGITKSKTAGPIAAGATMTSSIRITNSGIAAAVYTAGSGAQPLRVVDTMSMEEEFVSASAGWTCTDAPNTPVAGQRRVSCVLDAGGTLAAGAFIDMSIVTRAAASLAAPINLTNTACTGATALTQLGLLPADGPQPPDGNQNGATDCASQTSIGTPVVSGQGQVTVTKESSRDGSTWVDAVASAPTVAATDNSMYWRFTITTPDTTANPQQVAIPTLLANDSLPAVLNTSSPGAGIPGYQTPAPVVSTSVLAGAALGGCSAMSPGTSNLTCSFSNVAPGTQIQVVVRVDRPIESGNFTNSVTLSSPNAVLTATPTGRLNDDAALIVVGRSDPAVMSKTANPPNSANGPRVGQDMSFTIVARNLGPNATTGSITVTDTVDPTMFAVLSVTANGGTGAPAMSCSVTQATGEVSCTTAAGADVRRYDFYTITINTRVLKPAILPAPVTPVVNSANVKFYPFNPGQNCETLSTAAFTGCNDPASSSNNTASANVDIRVPLVDLISKKSRVLPGTQTNFAIGDTLRYRFRAQNGGSGVVSRAENVQITDRITAPAGYTVTLIGVAAVNNVAAESGFTRDDTKTAATVSCTQASGNADVSCTLAPGVDNFIGPNAEVNFELTFSLSGPPAVVSLSNAARVCADETASGHESNGSCSFDPALALNNLASVSDLIFPRTDLSIAKTRVTPSPVAINQPVEYALVVRNLGVHDTTQMRIADVLPANFEWVTGGTFTPAATPGAFAGLSVSGLSCTATPASITTAGQQQTVNCVLDGNFPGSTDAANQVTVRLYARPKQGFYTGPYLTDRGNTATVSPGLDGLGQPLSLDTVSSNNSATAQVQVNTISLAGTVFEDRVRDAANAGTPQAAAQEPRIAGGSIRLHGTDAFGNAIDLTTTVDASGNYSFANLPPSGAAGYTVLQVAQPAGYVNGPSPTPASGAQAPSAGGSYAAVGATGTSSYTTVPLVLGTTAVNYNFPEVRRPNLSGYVYRDDNQNSTRDPAIDTPIANATVQLLNAAGAVLQTTTTDGNGLYQFNSLDPFVVYSVREPLPTTPAGLVNGAVNPGLINALACASGCTAVPAGTATGTDRITAIDLSAGVDGTLFNFGEVQTGFISGLVWLDANKNGSIDASETERLGGVTVLLVQGLSCAGPVYGSTVTGSNGFYSFLAAPGQAYTICEQQPAAYQDASVAPGTAAVANGLNAITIANLPLTGSPNNNFGEGLGVLSGLVYLDANNDGIHQPLEPGFAGITLTLSGLDANGASVQRTTTTDTWGNYRFEDLPGAGPAGYKVTQQVAQPLYAGAATSNGITTPGTIAGVPTGVATAVATTPSAISGILLPAGAESIRNNFGEVLPVSLSGTVFLDPNDNGLQDLPQDTGLAGVTLVVTGVDASGAAIAPRTVVTDADGRYVVTGLPPGVYTVTEPTQPAGTSNGQTVPGSTGGTATPTTTTPSAITGISLLTPGTASVQNNFGEGPGAEIRGWVYLDANNNGQKGTGESGLPSITIQLSGTDNLGQPVQAQTTTAADGSYAFVGLRPGTYTVTEPSQPPATANGITTPGSLGGSATPVAQLPSAISSIVLPAAGRSLENNFGEVNESPDLRVSKAMVHSPFTVGLPGTYTITVRNAGQLASSGSYTVQDRLPAGLTLAATPSGPGWTCTGTAGASSFSCSSSTAIAAGATSTQIITAVVNVAASAETNPPVNNAVLVEGGGETDVHRPTPAEREAFNGNPAALPVCTPAVEHNACRTPTPVQQPASLSGTVWYDIGPATRVLEPGDSRLPGWIVEVINPATGQIVGTATTGPDGSYRVINLEPGIPLVVRFRDPDSGVVFGYPVNGETAPGSSGADCQPTPPVGKASSCEGKPQYQPQLTVVLAAGKDLPQQSLPVDPSGVVYDSGTRVPVPGSVVSLQPVGTCVGWNPATAVVGANLGGYRIDGTRIEMTVGSQGFYQYLFGSNAPASCRFTLTVTPPVDSGYIAPSTVIPPAVGTLAPSGGPGSTYAVQPQPTPPTGPVGPATIYYTTIVSGSGTSNIVHNHLPLDALLPGVLAVSKTGDKATVEMGDTLRYSITVMVPSGALPRQTTVLDRLPPGFTYIPGTAMLGSTRLPDPQGGLGPVLAFNLGRMPESRQLVLTYRVRVGVGAQQGDGVNRAQAIACAVPAGCVGPDLQPLPGTMASDQSAYRVRIGGGVFTTEACVLGKVYVDCNGNQRQDAEELGIPGVRLVMQDGTTLVSDSEGKYSVCGLPPRSAVLKVDALTLPRGARLVTSSNRNLGDAGSLWLDLKNGELHRADFIEGSCSNTVLEQTKARRAQGEVRAPEAEKAGGPALRFDSKAQGRTTLTAPQQGSDGANQRLPKPRPPEPPPPGAAADESNLPTDQLPMNRPAPVGRDSAAANDAGAQNGTR